MTTSTNKRRVTFDQVALEYDQVRPGYPEALFDDVVTRSHIPPDGRILEVGCGTGQATIPFARRGYQIDGIELGENLAAVARHNLAVYPKAKVLVGAFETWPHEDQMYSLLVSATAFHWIDPAVRYQRAAQVLKPDGHIALFWNKHVQTAISADFFEAVQGIYLREVSAMARNYPGLPHPKDLLTPVTEEIDQSGLFGEVTVLRYPWNVDYDSTEYISLLNTYSDHLSLDVAVRGRLFGGIAELIGTQFGNRITKEYLTILYLSRRK